MLTGAVTLNQALAKDPRGETYLLAMPRRPANSATMFASRPMQRLVSVLRDGADFVVIDCGRSAPDPKPAIIARLADATVLVSKRQTLARPAGGQCGHEPAKRQGGAHRDCDYKVECGHARERRHRESQDQR